MSTVFYTLQKGRLLVVFLLITASFFVFTAKAQLFTKKEIIQASLVFASGFTDGIEETLKFNYKCFKAVHPHANDKFWNPKFSWMNKYENYLQGDKSEAYFLSKSVLVWTTDGYHLTRFISNSFVTAGLIISACDLKEMKGRRLLLTIGKRIVLFSIARGLGQYCSYNIIYDKQF